jgi:hypothetical protein
MDRTRVERVTRSAMLVIASLQGMAARRETQLHHAAGVTQANMRRRQAIVTTRKAWRRYLDLVCLEMTAASIRIQGGIQGAHARWRVAELEVDRREQLERIARAMGDAALKLQGVVRGAETRDSVVILHARIKARV